MHDYLLALIGGILIGSAAVVLMAVQGRVMGISGIVSGLLPSGANPAGSGADEDRSWRLAFLGGAIAAPLISVFILEYRPPVTFVVDGVLLMLAGAVVGIGTVIGNGCTSGHGVCGLARLSGRSIVATAIFMSVAIVTVFLVRLGGGA